MIASRQQIDDAIRAETGLKQKPKHEDATHGANGDRGIKGGIRDNGAVRIINLVILWMKIKRENYYAQDALHLTP